MKTEVYVLIYQDFLVQTSDILGIVEDNEEFMNNLYKIFQSEAADNFEDIDEAFETLLEDYCVQDECSDTGSYILEKYHIHS